MRALHVAAMPFPSHQGTQALIHQMLSALSAAGHETHLLCYAHGAFTLRPAYTVHRISPAFEARSLRSGPSFQKLVLDGLLTRSLSTLLDVLCPDVVIAHHVEAALAALAARVKPFMFIAHTSLAAELPSYFSRRWRAPLTRFGARLDRFVCRRAGRVLAVSPLLAELLSEQDGPRAFPLSVPWPLSAPTAAAERRRARAEFGFAPDAEVVLYAGNLDGYQGLGPLLAGLEGLARQRPALRFLVGTESDPRALVKSLQRSILGSRLLLAQLSSEPKRRALHAAADVVVVPRGCAGGVPVKLLDALARGQIVIATQRAAARLDLAAACTLIGDDDADAWQAALESHFSQPSRGLSARLMGRSQLAHGHSPARFVADIARHVTALGTPTRPVYEARSAGDMVQPEARRPTGDTLS
jgi:glycosyltransferase involved in cell wall biosynthesis